MSACVPGGAGGWGSHRRASFWAWGPSPCTAAGSLQHPATSPAAMATGGGPALLRCLDSSTRNGDWETGAGWRRSRPRCIRPPKPPPRITERCLQGPPAMSQQGEHGAMFPNGGHSPAGIAASPATSLTFITSTFCCSQHSQPSPPSAPSAEQRTLSLPLPHHHPPPPGCHFHSQQVRPLGTRWEGAGGRATLTSLLIQMYKDTSYTRQRGAGQDAREGRKWGRPPGIPCPV